ncbi:hypothetical protein N0M98_19555 [Paenibacillus doosanensis]|uniref:hypothetical protein n=1 Tax=Paenibacillus konkukensis TaxID=2020716 RepID=UPI00201D8A96|nr:hypothetical protein [Paenibacillus konkukensis]MCS7462341.1 hypothetical protein [Paenibacillus doosanensis]
MKKRIHILAFTEFFYDDKILIALLLENGNRRGEGRSLRKRRNGTSGLDVKGFEITA